MMRKPIHKFTKYTDLKEMLQKSGEKFGDRPAYIFKTEEKGKFREITHSEFREEINDLGTKLLDLGLKNKRIAVISENRYEWAVDYLAVATGVGVIVPLDKSLPNNEIESLIKRSEVEAIFYSKKYDEVMNKIKEQNETNLKYFISMDLEKEENGIKSQKELAEQGKALIDNGNRDFLDAKIDNEKMGIMLFTSGTTAMSKAVMLSHKNICSNLADIASVIKVTEKDRFLSFLPLHHTFECTVGFLYPISVGGAICFCDGIRHIAENIKEYKITAMISVPILFESMYKKVMKGIEKKGKLETVKKGMKISQFLLKFGIDIRKQLFKEIHQTLGEDARLFVSGGAALDPETEKGFNAMGFTMYQGYGLTESSPVIAAEDDKYQRIGSIGKAFPSIEAKIINPDEDGIGELVAKGPSIMLGYYNNEEATKETLEGEWLHTGDLARIDKDGYIFISGRKKFVIVLKNGKNIFPEELETLVNKIEGVKESFVYGRPEDDGDYKICAKLVYDPEVVKEKYGTTDEKELKDILWKEVKKVNKEMPAYKYIRDISVTDKELIKTTTQKTKRAEEIKTVL
ncbi:MAG: long-chain fatty acid--CoA ligase [Clostridiales bacterium]|nr:long-chain fatty acid--CoA ligase [Clostridiales bacterium]